MRTIIITLGFLLYCLKGGAKNKTFWHALSNYTGRYIYLSNKPYTYKRIKDGWNYE